MAKAPPFRSLLVFAALLAAVGIGLVGSGVRDEPTLLAGERATLTLDASTHVWQQQVRAGVEGQLVGVRLALAGPSGARVRLSIRPGFGWSRATPVFERELVTTGIEEQVFVDTASAHFALTPSQRFVVELAALDVPATVAAIHTDSPFGSVDRGEPLFLSALGAFDDGGWRIALETFVSAGDITEFCFGRACPCDNDTGAAGCLNSSGHGARLYEFGGSTSVGSDDLCVLTAGLPRGTSGALFIGSAQARAPFGDGLLCVGGATRVVAVGASSKRGALIFDHIVSRAAGVVTPGSTWFLQTWYRDPLGPCNGSANLSNALSVAFRP